MSLPQVADATASSARARPLRPRRPPGHAGGRLGGPGPRRAALRAEPGGHPADPDLCRERAGHGGPGQPGVPDLARLVGGRVGIPRRDRADHGPRPGGGPAARPAVARPVLVAAAATQTAVALALTGSPAPGPSSGCPSASACARRCSSPASASSSRWPGGPGSPGRRVPAGGHLGGFTVGPLLAGVLTAAGGTGLALGAVAAVYGLGAVGLRALPLAARPAGLAGADAPAPGSQAGSLGRQASAGAAPCG